MSDPSWRCATCRWWVAPEPNIGMDARDGLVERGWGLCALTMYQWEHSRQIDDSFLHPISKAIALDREQYKAELMTAPDFGCVQWEPKP